MRIAIVGASPSPLLARLIALAEAEYPGHTIFIDGVSASGATLCEAIDNARAAVDNAATAMSEAIAVLKQCPIYEDCGARAASDSQQGIRELRDWLAHRTRQILNFSRVRQLNLRRILFNFQPAWSSRRWKSLT